MRRARLWTCVLAAAAAFAFTPVEDSHAGTVPAGFTDELVTTLAQPVGLAFTPDERLLFATKPGPVRVYSNGTLLSQAALDLSAVVCADGERGLLGLAVDPEFEDNHFIYLYYTFKKHGTCEVEMPLTPVNRVSRFVLGNNNVVNPASETVLIDGIPSRNGLHNAGDLEFGKDGYLYVTTGDGGCDFRGDSGCFTVNDAARDLGGLSGKILRVTRNGGIPVENPYTGPDSDRCATTGSTTVGRKCREIFAWGLRNPFRFAFDPNSASTRFFINDVGVNVWEEVDLGGPGVDYGWNVREGPCVRQSSTNCGPPPAGMTNPIYWYGHAAGCSSITLGAFVPGNVWPDSFVGSYIYGDSVCGKLFVLRQQGAGYVASEFGTNMPNLIDGIFGPNGETQALYYISWVAFPNNQVRRITSTGATNRAPEAQATADPASGDLPLMVGFDGSQSTDPDDDELTYSWDFGDGSPDATGAQATHTYDEEGTFTATLTVSDGRGGQDQTTIRIDAGNNAPGVAISAPAPGALFRVGQQITLSGAAFDPEDEWLPASALSWRVERHHNTHTHPYLQSTQGSNVTVVGPEPEDLESAGNSYLDIYLTATDSKGLSETTAREMHPRKVDLTFNTTPNHFRLEIAGEPITAPRTVTSWENWQLPVRAFNQRSPAGGFWRFTAWSDGGAPEHEIPTPTQPATYSATFAPYRYARPGVATPLRVPLVPAYTVCTAPTAKHVAPLNHNSCPSPALESSLVTTARTGRGAGNVQLKAIHGNASTPADEADVGISVTATDVRRASDGADLGTSLMLRSALRITDTANSSFGDEPATVFDTAFTVPVPCAATPDATTGSTCGLATTADTLVPGFATEGKRTLLAVRSITLEDAGADGQIVPATGPCPPACGTGDERVFMREGLFAP